MWYLYSHITEIWGELEGFMLSEKKVIENVSDNLTLVWYMKRDSKGRTVPNKSKILTTEVRLPSEGNREKKTR